MQEKAFEIIPLGLDTILLSLTGSGKTLAFLLPLLSKIENDKANPQLLIITPTRELALQIHNVIHTLALGLNTTCCYGGHPIRFEKTALQTGPSVVVGTPGRILDHMERKNINPENVKLLVLDEFDKILEMGFHDQMESVVKFLKYKPQYILTSATEAIDLPEFLPLLNPQRLDYIQTRRTQGIQYWKVISSQKDKLPALKQLIEDIGRESTFVFVNFRESAQRIHEEFTLIGIRSEVFHGGLDQEQRETVLSKFRNHSIKILVTTDLAGRGLDIPKVQNIVHYHMPIDEEAFIHRNGRTARMDAQGEVYLIIHKEEVNPSFIPDNIPTYEAKNTFPDLNSSDWQTLKINRGRRDKIRKFDIVGFLSKIGKLGQDELGLVEVKENHSLAAIKSEKIDQVCQLVNGQKVKGKKARVNKI